MFSSRDEFVRYVGKVRGLLGLGQLKVDDRLMGFSHSIAAAHSTVHVATRAAMSYAPQEERQTHQGLTDSDVYSKVCFETKRRDDGEDGCYYRLALSAVQSVVEYASASCKL